MNKSKYKDALIQTIRSKSLWTSLIIGSISAGFLLRHRRNSTISKPSVNDSTYIYLPVGQHSSGESFPSSLTEFGSEGNAHWKILRLARSPNNKIRQSAISSLIETKTFNDATCQEIAQSCDRATALELCRSQGVDHRYFLKPPKIPQEFNQDELRISLCKLLSRLPKQDEQSCLQYLTHLALTTVIYDLEETVERLTDGDGGHTVRGSGLSSNSILRLCLEALRSHSTQNSLAMIELGALQILQRHVAADDANQHMVARIICNLTLNPQLHSHIFASGWLGILSKWFSSGHLEMELLAGQAMANLLGRELYHDGVYLLHPLDREAQLECERGLKMDIVFVHGLLGGVFRTWRQNDRARTSGEYTQCWPKYWLADDVKGIRVLALDYDTSLSDWNAKCPFEKHKKSLSARSEEFLWKLAAAGLGDRPIVWVTHSMGGILLKELLDRSSTHAEAKLRKLSQETRGVVFYSVPHRGSSIKLNFLTLPSVEVQEIHDEDKLKKLQDNFLNLVKERGIACLSFGESLKTSLGIKLSLQLVPSTSADPGYGVFHELPLDHLNICKPKSKSCDIYKLLLHFIQEQLNADHNNISEHDDFLRNLQQASCLSF